MLSNLHDVAIKARQKYRDEFTANEFVLTNMFKEAFKTSLRKDNQSVDFTAHTAVITTAGNLKMYIPNQWFGAAAYMVPFIQEFLAYKAITDDYFSNAYGSNQERKEAVKKLKETDDAEIIENFNSSIKIKLKDSVSAEELEDTARLVTNFVSNYEWWFGNKTIDRGDSYVSPVLSLLGVVNASQGYIADICYKFATEDALASAAMQMIEANPVIENEGQHIADIEPERLTGGINEIVYGAPGTGKSRYLDDKYAHSTISTRVVFHPEYTVFDFVGSYKPVPIYKKTDAQISSLGGEALTYGEPLIDYRFIPGPFINCLVNSWLDPAHMHTLIIEEINRANTAAVFGEIFQLLDRDINGNSEYSIEPTYDLRQYLLSIDGMQKYISNGLRIPSNMNIVATMNSADQGVMPMDSAFKRRWAFMYIRIAIEGAVHEGEKLTYSGREVTWGNLVRSVNAKLMSLGCEEDRLIGPYFIKPEEIGNKRATDKLLLYLWDDVLRHNREAFFHAQVRTFSELSEEFSKIDVFDLMSRPDTTALLNSPAAETLNDEDLGSEVED